MKHNNSIDEVHAMRLHLYAIIIITMSTSKINPNLEKNG
ncbi:hypothetical protein ACHAXS_009675 [Conticribra weissflogii]